MKFLKILIIASLLITLVEGVSAATITFTVLENNTATPIENAIVTLVGVSDSDFSNTTTTDSSGIATFINIPNAIYVYVITHQAYQSDSYTLFVTSDRDLTVYLEPLTGTEWHPLDINNGDLRITWSSTDPDNIYNGGERMNSVSEVRNVRDSGHIILDHTTSLHRNTYYSDGSPTEWNSAHTPDYPMAVHLKPNGGWITNTMTEETAEECIGKAIVYLEGTSVDLSGDEFICIYEIRNENLVPFYINGSVYMDFVSDYKINDVIYTISGQTDNFTVLNEGAEVNHRVVMNDLSNSIGIEGENIRFSAIAMDPDNDEIIATINDSRFVYNGREGNSYVFYWQTELGDTGIYSVAITTSDGEFFETRIADVVVLEEFQIDLVPGLNIISVPFVPVVGDFENNYFYEESANIVLESIVDSLASAFAFNNGVWTSYDPDKPDILNTLHNIDESNGLWLNMESADTLTITGLKREPVNLSLSTGLNLIGYPSSTENTPSNVFNNVYSEYENIITYNATNNEWTSYNPDKPSFLNSLHNMIPGYGYWVMTSANTNWNFNGGVFN
jgi:hypothetical protein